MAFWNSDAEKQAIEDGKKSMAELSNSTLNDMSGNKFIDSNYDQLKQANINTIRASEAFNPTANLINASREASDITSNRAVNDAYTQAMKAGNVDSADAVVGTTSAVRDDSMEQLDKAEDALQDAWNKSDYTTINNYANLFDRMAEKSGIDTSRVEGLLKNNQKLIEMIYTKKGMTEEGIGSVMKTLASALSLVLMA